MKEITQIFSEDESPTLKKSRMVLCDVVFGVSREEETLGFDSIWIVHVRNGWKCEILKAIRYTRYFILKRVIISV